MKLVTIIGSSTNCGRTAQNSILTEALVFHQTLSTPKASYSERCPSGTPRGRTQKIHIFPKDPIMRMSYNTSPFHTSEFLKKYIIIIPNTRVRNDKQRNLKITSSGRGEDSVWAHQKDPPHNGTLQALPATGVNKPWVHNVLARLTRLGGIISRLQGIW